MSEFPDVQTLAPPAAARNAAPDGREPLFIDRPGGRLFAIHHPPAGAAYSGEAVLYLHPFAEEMNQSRRMATLQAEALAALGHGVLALDLTGCGDSTGEFADGRWPLWRDDVAEGCRWLRAHGYEHVTLWGLRLGAALAVEAASLDHGICHRLMLWQPVVGGKTLLTQFLRLRIAAAMDSGGGETTKSLRATLAEGRSIEVGGYELAPEMAAALDALDLSGAALAPELRIDWIEVVPEADRGPSPASERVIAKWRDAGLAPEVETVVGEAFWSIQETTLAPALIARTTELMGPAGATRR
jgi:exosortase A-associated hydrolase 2